MSKQGTPGRFAYEIKDGMLHSTLICKAHRPTPERLNIEIDMGKLQQMYRGYVMGFCDLLTTFDAIHVINDPVWSQADVELLRTTLNMTAYLDRARLKALRKKKKAEQEAAAQVAKMREAARANIDTFTDNELLQVYAAMLKVKAARVNGDDLPAPIWAGGDPAQVDDTDAQAQAALTTLTPDRMLAFEGFITSLPRMAPTPPAPSADETLHESTTAHTPLQRLRSARNVYTHRMYRMRR